MKERTMRERKQEWENYIMHVQFLKETKKSHIADTQMWNLLTKGDLQGETEALTTACHDQAIATNYYSKSKVQKTLNGPKCQLCELEQEIVYHIVPGCLILAKKNR